MAKRRLNPNLAKIHRNYTVEEVAILYGVHKNTVRAWLKNGLKACNDTKPLLILGCDLREFLKTKNNQGKQKCKLWEIYCVRCREPKEPYGGMVDYQPRTSSKGSIVGLCPCCESPIYKFFSLAKLEGIIGKLDVGLPKALKHINELDKPFLNCDLKQ